MYVIREEECFLSPESIIWSALAAADVAVDLDEGADDSEADGWARHADMANGFGGALLTSED